VVEGDGANNLTQVIVVALNRSDDLDVDAIFKSLFFFGVDGMNTFQGARSSVTKLNLQFLL